MTAVTTELTVDKTPEEKPTAAAGRALTSPWASVVAIFIAVLWTTPTFGLLVTSFRRPQDILANGWWNAAIHPNFTFDNYHTVIFGGDTRLSDYFINSIIITLPAVVIPVALASLAAYAFAWTKFKGRDSLFIAVFALQVVPLQVALIPLLTIYVRYLHMANTYWSVWLSHSIFALPFAIFLLHNFMKEIPEELVEAARMDGANHATIFFRVLMPLIKPAIAAFAIFQFLWVWNDLLVSLTFLGGAAKFAPITVRMSQLSGQYGGQWFLLSAGAFVSIVVPVLLFVSAQRFFVRGLLAGGLKG
jgi:alpha-glucoside transport system permease protein